MLDVRAAADRLRSGELVALPTETVYGLGADARNAQAVARIFAVKGRPADHPLIVHLPDVAALADWAVDIPDAAYALARAFWPGPLTLILKRHPSVPDAVTGGQDTVGLRVPNHPLALALLREFGGGIAAPSANKFGRISPTTAQHVRDEFGDAVPVLDGGPCGVGIESTILDLSGATPRILRPGHIGPEALAKVLGYLPDAGATKPSGASTGPDVPRVSGSLEAHYAPRTPMQLVVSSELMQRLADQQMQGHRVAVLARQPAPPKLPAAHWQVASTDPRQYAHDLYAALRQLDALAADLIVVEAPEAGADWAAVADRLGRAVVGSGVRGPD